MKADVILIRYGELALKSAYVRRVFEATLLKNIQQACVLSALSCDLSKERGRLYLKTDNIQKACSLLQKIFGIVSCSPAHKTSSTMAALKKAAVALCSEKFTPQKSFALRVTRTGTHSYTSQDVAVEVGKHLVETFRARVDLTTPDIELFIEIRQDTAYFFLEKRKGVGGFPMGTQGRILALIEDTHSILASWYLLKRGCQIIFLVMDSSLHSQVEHFQKYWYLSSEVVTLETNANVIPSINTLVQTKKCDAVCCGITLTKTSGDVLSRLHDYKNQLTVPLLHPLIAFEHEDLEEKWKQVGGIA